MRMPASRAESLIAACSQVAMGTNDSNEHVYKQLELSSQSLHVMYSALHVKSRSCPTSGSISGGEARLSQGQPQSCCSQMSLRALHLIMSRASLSSASMAVGTQACRHMRWSSGKRLRLDLRTCPCRFTFAFHFSPSSSPLLRFDSASCFVITSPSYLLVTPPLDLPLSHILLHLLLNLHPCSASHFPSPS